MNPDEFDAHVRRVRRGPAILWALRDISDWIKRTKADPDDIRNTPDLQNRKGGGTFVSDVTALDSLLEHVEIVRSHHRAGDWEMAQAALAELRARIEHVNARPAKEAARKGGRARAKPQRDIEMAKQFSEKFKTSTMSRTDLKASIGRKFKLRRSAAIEAIDRGLLGIRRQK